MTSETTDFSMTGVEHCPVSVPWSSVRSKNTVIQLAMVHCRRREQSSKCRCTLPHHHRRTGRQEASRHWHRQRGSSFSWSSDGVEVGGRTSVAEKAQ